MRECQKRATQKYCAKAYDAMLIRVPKGMRELFKEMAAGYDMSLAAFTIKAMCEYAKTHPVPENILPPDTLEAILERGAQHVASSDKARRKVRGV